MIGNRHPRESGVDPMEGGAMTIAPRLPPTLCRDGQHGATGKGVGLSRINIGTCLPQPPRLIQDYRIDSKRYIVDTRSRGSKPQLQRNLSM